MPESRRGFVGGHMDLDSDSRLLPQDSYRRAENIIVLDSETSEVGAVQNPYSNKKLTNINFGLNVKTIGVFADEAEDKIYWFLKSDTGCYLMEWDNTNQVSSFVLVDTRPLDTRVLNLDENFLITGVVKIISEDNNQDLLGWTDNNMQPCCINIARSKTFPINGFEFEDILLIKHPPPGAPFTQLIYTGGLENYIEEEFLSFSYRYKYLDGEYSALSDYTNYNFIPGPFQLNYETVENLGMINFFNAVYIGFNTGDKRVTDIQVVVKKSNSNSLYIIETFNKENEGWGNDETRYFTFSNNKIYQILPLRELYRAFDNVPLKARALTSIGNRFIFGNYVEGRDLITAAGRKLKLDYYLGITSNNVTGVALPYTLYGGDTPDEGTKLILDLSGFDLVAGARISLNLVMKSVHYEVGSPVISGSFIHNVSVILNNDYATPSAFYSSPEFIAFIHNLQNVFLQNYTLTPPPNSELTLVTTFGFIAGIFGPTFTFTIDDTPGNPDDDDTSEVVYDWRFYSDTTATFSTFGIASSLKTNRSYEVGIVYRDEYKRATTVLTTPQNTKFIPQSLSTFQNKLKVTINHAPPAWAIDYKIVVKAPILAYQTIYAVLFYEEGIYRWVRLDGANKDKVKEGDTLILKADLSGPRNDVFKVRVIDIKDQPKNFIENNVNPDNTEIIEEPGLYMKIKGTDINMEVSGQSYFNYFDISVSNPPQVRVGAGSGNGTLVGYFDDATSMYVDIPINAGTRITLKFAYITSSTSDNESFHQTTISQNQYSNFQDWYEAEALDPGPNFIVTFERNMTTNALYMVITSPAESFSFNSAVVTVQLTEALLIFETEPVVVENEIFYECEQAFKITNGFHEGNLQNQSDFDLPGLVPAIIDLDFFNCFVMGNGAESYRIKDVINKNYLNIDLRPSATSIEGYKQIRRYADITFSEAFIESTNLNGLNVFNISTGNFKELDKQYGSVQKLDSRDTNILVLQEEKASEILFGKQNLHNADGTGNVVTTDLVLGDQQTYQGDNGIGVHPESYARNDYQVFYANPKRGVIQRLSIDGTTDIIMGLSDYFRSLFITNGNAKMLGGFDPYFKHYVVSVGDEPEKIYSLQCGNTISRANQTVPFTYTLNLNYLTGDIVLSYNITGGSADITTVLGDDTVLNSGLTAAGTLSIPRTDIDILELQVTITPVTSVSYDISNACPLGESLRVIQIVIGDAAQKTATIQNRYAWDGSTFYSSNDMLSVPVSRFIDQVGSKGRLQFPEEGSLVIMQSYKDEFSSGNFTGAARLRYLVDKNVRGPEDYLLLRSASTALSATQSFEGENEAWTGSFVFNTSDPSDILYLIFDYGYSS